jgi:hypothetical protein
MNHWEKLMFMLLAWARPKELSVTSLRLSGLLTTLGVSYARCAKRSSDNHHRDAALLASRHNASSSAGRPDEEFKKRNAGPYIHSDRRTDGEMETRTVKL